jgi:hypothetical protein
MNKKQLQFYQEKAKEKGKLLFIEECNSIITSKNVEFLKEGRFVEAEGKQYKALAIVKNCPVSKYTENKNRRVYSKQLWETVKSSGLYEGTYSLADHPVEEGSVKDTWGIWHNLHLNENGAFSDLYLIEEKPVRILEAGGSLGTSTVGYGEFLEDQKTVNPQTFELERLGDIVLNPSQGTYATFENIQESTQKNEEKDKSFFKEFTNNKQEIIEKIDNNLEGISEMNKTEILNAKNQIKVALKRIKESANYRESLDELEELYADIPEELQDQKTKVTEAISLIKTRMEEEIKKASTSLEDTKNELSELKTKYETVNDALTEMTEKYKKAEKIINKAGIAEGSDIIIEDVKVMKENISAMKEDLKQYAEDRKNMEADIACYEEDRAFMEDDIAKFKEERISFKEEIEKLEKQLKKAESHITKCEEKLEKKYGYKFDEEDEDEDEEEIDVDDNAIVTESGLVVQPIIEAEIDDNITATNLPDSGVDYVNVVDETNGVNNYADIEETKVDTEDVEDYDEDIEAEGRVETPAETQVAPTFTEEEETDVVGDLEDNDEITESYVFGYPSDRPKTKIQETVKRPVNNKKIQVKTTQKILDFYNEMTESKPYLKNFAKEILSSKTLSEAVEKISALKKNSNNEVIKIQESNVSQNDTIAYKFGY